jgi:hypothetical protein
LLACLALTLVACGGGSSSSTATTSSLSGNWVITLNRQANPEPLTYTGFLLQSGDSVTGSLVLGDGCAGVGPVRGTVDGQNLQLDVNEFGQNLTLTGTLPTSGGSGAFVGGPFSTLIGGCTGASTGTWSGTRIPPLTGPFHGTLTSDFTNGTVSVAGNLTQGPNVGASNADFSGTLTTTGVPPFCSYVTSASITGNISGTTANVLFFGPNGSQLNLIPIVATIAPDASSLNAKYDFEGISKTCTGDIGTLQLSFP